MIAFGENQAHQTDKITLSGTVETGDVYTVTINATKASYRVQDGDTMADVQSGLINVLNAGASDTIVVTAGATSDEIIVRANRTGMQEEFQVNSTTYHEQTNPSATTLADGGVIVTWQSQYQDYSSTWGVFGQRFDVSGKALGEEFPINAYTNSGQTEPSVTALDDGGFAVTWTDDSSRSPGSSSDLYAKTFTVTDASGNPVATPVTNVEDFLVSGGLITTRLAATSGILPYRPSRMVDL